jgi:hypothetical protein
MDEAFIYEICVEGHLTERWSEWFDELTIHNETSGETVLSGAFIDQAALFGTLTKIHSLNLTLVSVKRFSSS